ncbi:MAG: 6-phosphofructokinase [Anaerostipes hadrus]
MDILSTLVEMIPWTRYINYLFTVKRHNIDDIKVMGAPKTIDNDLGETDHCPGFGSAAKFIATAFTEIACDCFVYDVPSVTIVEVMGRNAGWLTAIFRTRKNQKKDEFHS